MTPEAQRIAIAEACGWKIKTEPPCAGMAWRPRLAAIPTYKFCDIDLELLPDYLNDLNAMHEAEKVLPGDVIYQDKLAEVTKAGDSCTNWWEDSSYRYLLIHTTAAQRAEAFLRTLGKWVES